MGVLIVRNHLVRNHLVRNYDSDHLWYAHKLDDHTLFRLLDVDRWIAMPDDYNEAASWELESLGSFETIYRRVYQTLLTS